jgi:hypothetical protein
MQQQAAYPVRFTVDYPDRPLDRLTTGLRIIPSHRLAAPMQRQVGETRASRPAILRRRWYITQDTDGCTTLISAARSDASDGRGGEGVAVAEATDSATT